MLVQPCHSSVCSRPPAGKTFPVNLRYTTEELARYYSEHRVTWDEFYPSEKHIFERIAPVGATVLDVGCAVGGLGRALHERFGLSSYTGTDLSAPAVREARSRSFPVAGEFYCNDILDPGFLADARFSLVCSLSCADYNVECEPIIAACWERVAEDGWLVLSLRLTPGEGVNDLNRSFQYIHFGDEPLTGAEERASYVIFNTSRALALLSGLGGSEMLGYGYWGKPSVTARTPYDRLIFAVFGVRRGGPPGSARLELPVDSFADTAQNC